VVEAHVRDAGDLAAAAGALRPFGASEPDLDVATRRISLPVQRGTDDLTAAARALGALGVAVDDLTLRRPTLDEVFLALTGAPTATTELERSHA
jgi:ABC-2 type transport system ATP-binding protein